MLFALLNNSKILGLFDNYDSCTNMLDGIISNKFLEKTEMNIIAYENNSIKLVKPADIFFSETIDDNISENDTTASESENNTTLLKSKPSETKEEKDKKERNMNRLKKRTYNLNILKQRKERINENKRIFLIDLELYKKFKELKNKDSNFVIPEIFNKKYILMSELEKIDKLTIDAFYQIYEYDNGNSKWDSLFTGNAKDRDLINVSSDED